MNEEIKTALAQPTKIAAVEYDEAVRHYYGYRKEQAEYLLVIVKYLNGEGFVITAYLTKKIQ